MKTETYYSTRFLFAEGVIEVTGKRVGDHVCVTPTECMKRTLGNQPRIEPLGGPVWKTREQAVKEAEQLRSKRLEKLNEEIEHIKSLRFE